MAAITWDDVTALASELSTVTAAAQALYLEMANAHFSPSRMGGEDSVNLKLARIYLAAHFATVAGYASAGVAGPITESRLGDETTKYGGSTLSVDLASSDEYNASAYGRLLQGLLKSTPGVMGPHLL